MAPTKDELEQRVAELEQRNAELEAAAAAPAGTAGNTDARTPSRPTDDNGKPILSAGEAFDLEQNGTAVSPFTGETLNALDEGVEPATPQARRRAEDHQRTRTEVVPNEWPIAGPPPAEGGDSDPNNTNARV